MSLPSACLHSQGPHLAVSGGENWENSRLVRAKTLTVNIKERQRRRVRERESYLDKTKLGLESPEHIISTTLSLHTQGTVESGEATEWERK